MSYMVIKYAMIQIGVLWFGLMKKNVNILN